jgi:large repetitive protein
VIAARVLVVVLFVALVTGVPLTSGATAEQTPTPEISSKPAPVTSGTSATFEFADSDSNATLECRLDNGEFSVCLSPKTYSSLADGQHTFGVRAVDPSNTEPISGIASYTWTVDTIPPPPPTIQGPPNPTNSTSASFTFSDSEPGVTFACRLDASGFPPCSNPTSYDGPLDEGEHTLRARAVDAAGNASPTSSYTWTIDTVPPALPAIGAHADVVATSTTTFTFSSAGASRFECHVDAAAFSPCSSGDSFGPLINGVHTFYVRAFDIAGNASTATSFQWTIATASPAVATIGPHANVVGSSTTTFTFSSVGASRFECRVDAAAFSPCSSGDSFGPLGDGAHSFFVRAFDAVGNVSDAASFQWTIDTVPPTVPTIAAHADVVATSTTTFTFSSVGASRFECYVDAAAFSSCSSGDSFGPLVDGSHSFFVRAFDAAGNASAVASVQWTIDTINPVITLIEKPPTITNQKTASFSFSSSKPGRFECALDAAIAPCNNTSPLLYTGLADGAHTFSVRATATNTGPGTRYTWTVDTVAPATTLTASPPVSSSSPSASFAFTSSEPDSTFVCTLDASGITPCASPNTYTGLGDGRHTFKVQAVDLAGNTDATPASYSWQINGVGPATIDRTPPGNVKRLRRTVGYGVLKITWTRPSDADFDHVKVFVSTSANNPPRTLVYKGADQSYTNKRFKNGLYSRYAVLSYDRAGNASRGETVVIPPSILLRVPRDGAVVKGPPVLVWSAVRRTSFYNVQLYYRTRKVLSAWPNVAKLGVKRTWLYADRRYRLKNGVYHWYVWPGFGPRAKARYGQLLGQGTFIVRGYGL